MIDWDYAYNVWGGLSHQLGGRTVSEGTDYKIPKIIIPYNNLEMELSCQGKGNSASTMLKVEFSQDVPFRFSISPRTANSSVVIRVDLPVQRFGDSELDQNFIIRTSNKPKLLQLLEVDKIKQAIITKLCSPYWGIQNQPNGKFLMSFQDTTLIVDQDRLEDLVKIFKLTLDTMVDMKIMHYQF